MPLLLGLLVIVSLLLSAQAAWALYMMVYTWDQPDVDDLARLQAQDLPRRTVGDEDAGFSRR